MGQRIEGWNYARALRELWNRSSYERGLISDPFGDTTRAERGLRRMRALLGELGNPESRVPAVHVAGSKGKGSTASFIALSARQAGYRVGLYTSPHLHRFPERIALDGRPIPDEAFASVASIVAEAAQALETKAPDLGAITTFEFVTAMAFTAFANADCQLSVVEVGLGGLYDATNVLSPIVAVITRIDFEHTAVLGSTLGEIATQKAGIIRPRVPTVSSPQDAEAKATIERIARERRSPVFFGGQDWHWHGSWRGFDAEGPWGKWQSLSLGTPGSHQIENATTALAALHVVNAGGLNIPERAIRTALANAHWPGRFERIQLPRREVVFDGAHTPAAASALVETWHSEFGARKATVILGMGADKDIATFLQAIQPIVGTLIATRVDSPRAADPAVIAEVASGLGLRVSIEQTVADAVANVIAAGHEPLLITGSLFVAGEGREALDLASPDVEWRKLNDEKLSRTNAQKHP
jgi:dihydrofolate synthase/folylpolyglutamate synthase